MYYVIINNDNVCIGNQQSPGVISASNYIDVTEPVVQGIHALDWYMWRKYENGEWSSETYEPEPEPVQEYKKAPECQSEMADINESVTSVVEFITGGE